MRLLLDENVSPSIVRPLSQAGHDAYHVRDRGLIGRPDHAIWCRAVEESRILVTINARDIVHLARREELHGGLITFPSGSTPAQQLSLILRAIAYLNPGGTTGADLTNRWLEISEDGQIRVTALAKEP